MNWAQFSEFHFLRPQWLWAIVPALLLLWLVRLRDDPRRPWRGVIAPHLLDKLLINPGSHWRIRPVHLIVAALIIGAIGVAGPTWKREPTPFTEDTSPLVIAIDLSEDMDAIDIQPTRLERGKQKIRDLLKLRPGSRTALLAYAGGAYRILPLTDDPDLIELFLSSLSTNLMPKQGRDTVKALQLAQETLSKETAPGSILFVGSGIERGAFTAFKDYTGSTKNQILFLAVGTAAGGPISSGNNRFRTNAAGGRLVSRMDVQALKDFESQADALVTSVAINDDDIEWLQRRIQSHLVEAQNKDQHARWQDFGYFLTFPIVLLGALWFRKGWTVRWSTVIFWVILNTNVNAEFIDLWLTKDQQGRYAFEKGDYKTAAQKFQDPLWKGIAAYHAGDYPEAISSFAMVDSAEGYFHLGNCYAHLKKYADAITAYDEAIKRKPGFPEAIANRALVLSFIPKQKKDDEGEEAPDLPPDEVKFDDKGKRGKTGKVQVPQWDPSKMADIWMRRIQVTPADFLRQKFLIQEAQAPKQAK